MLKPSATDPKAIKADYAKYCALATRIIHTEGPREQILSSLKGNDPVKKLADVTVIILQKMDQVLRDSGQELQDSIKIFGAHAVVDEIADLGEAAGIAKYSEDWRLLALSGACQDYIKAEVAAGRINAQRLNVEIQAGLRQMPPKQRKDILDGMKRVEQIARKYNGGAGNGL